MYLDTAQGIINQQSGPNIPINEVQNLINQINQAQQALNGERNLEDAKRNATNTINNSPDLNNAQKDALKAQVSNGKRVADVKAIEQLATELNNNMTSLKEAIADKNDTLTSGNYINASDDKRQAYTNQVANAEDIIHGTNGAVLIPSEISNVASQVNSAKQDLNGDENLRKAKQNATTAVDGLTSLNEAQKDQLKQQIAQAQTLPDVDTTKNKATTLNDAMHTLRDSISNVSNIKTSQNYTDANQNLQDAYNRQVDNANGIINPIASPTMDPDAITQAATQVTTAEKALNGTENLRHAQQDALTHLDHLSHLTDAQKADITQQINQATHVSDVTAAQNSANDLNTAMDQLNQAIANQEAMKQSVNYTDADTNLKEDYSNAVQQAQQILDKAHGPNTSQTDVVATMKKVQAAEQALNGNQNVEHAKTQALADLEHLTSLNNAQKEALTQQINGATTVADVNQQSDKATELNTAMSQLQDGIANKQQTLDSQNYIDAEPSKQQAYNQAISTAEQLLDKDHGQNLDKDAVAQALAQVTSTKDALDGTQILEQAKTNATNAVNDLPNLTNLQKDELKRQIQQAQNVANVDNVKTQSQTLDQAMQALRQSIQDNPSIKAGQNYLDASNSNQNDYNTAIDQANAIIDATSQPNMSATEINQAATKVNETKAALNGAQNLIQAKEAAKNDIGQMNHLNQNQINALNDQVQQANDIAAVNALKDSATSLNTVMGQLKDSIANHNDVQQSVNYTDADTDKQQAYDNAVSQAEAITNPTSGTNATQSQVEAAIAKVNDAKQDLNGNRKVEEAKAAAKQALNTYANLNHAQVNTATQHINDAQTLEAVTKAQQVANTLNNTMGQLQQGIAHHQDVEQSVDYTDADTNKQQAYTDAVTKAQSILDKDHGDDLTQSQVEQALANVNQAQQDLNGEEKVQAAKTAAIQELGTYSNLNHAQSNTAQDRINNAQTLAEVAQAKQTAQDLNHAMGQLQQSIDHYQDVEQSVDYTDADTNKQSAYTNAVHQAQNTLDKDLGHDLTQSEVEQAIENVNHAKQELNGEEKVSEAKTNALQTLNNDTHLNQHQREAATNAINGATTLSQVAQALEQANALDTVMGQLKDSISKQASIKQQINYLDADIDRKTNYDDAVTNAQAILDPVNGNNLSKEQVEAAINQVNTTKDQLNGNTNLQNAKNEANTQLNALDYINHDQSDHLRDQIGSATSVEAVHQIQANAQSLDQAMQQLQQAIANQNDILNSQNYADANPDKKQAFDQALQNADNILDKATGPNSDKQAVEQAIQAITNMEQALNGAQNLHDAQTQAIQSIDNAPHLNEQQKNVLKEKVNQAQTVAAVTDLQNNADALNTSMEQLKQAIADHDTIVADGNYTNASPQEQGAYTDAYQRAQNLINGTPDVIINPADINTATQNVNNAEQGLNGNTNLANAKQEATNALQQMTGLSDAQRQRIQDQIDQAQQLPDIDTIKSNAGNLNHAMTELRQEVAKQHDVQASQPYVDANTSNQDDYNHAITNAESIINETTQPTLNPESVMQALNQIKTSTQDLNGVENLNQAKQTATGALQHLSHLNQAQQADLTQQLKDAPNIATVEQVKAKATSLDQAMEQLINAVNDKDQVHQSVNYSDADQPKQSAYDHAINDAQLITDPTTGSNASQSEVEAALSAINTAKQDLNGNRKVEDAKNNANQALHGLNHLNNAQRENIEHQIDQAQTLADIARLNNEAQALNNAMGQLADSLNDKTETLNSQNYNDASPDKKTDYTDAVSNAETILTPTQGGNLTKDEVEAAINAVNSKKEALNGKENLANAKQNANQTIDGLTHLTNPQKEALKQLVDQSTTVAEVNENENKAHAVDTAMEHLNQSIADHTETKNGQNYIDSSENNKDAYNNAVNTAQGIQNEVTNPVIDPTVINQAAETVTNTKDALNGRENLTHAKEDANQSVGTYVHLNNAQQKDIENKIKQATSVEEANQIKTEAENLNHAMNDLNQAIQDKDDIKSNVNYTDADPAKQEAYNNAINNAEHILSKTNGNNATQTEVAEAIQAVNKAKEALNGNANVQNAKIQATDTINNSNDLNSAQKEALKQQVADATTVADVNAIKQNAQDLNQAMTALKQGIANKDQILADGNYTNASPDKQQAYNDAVKHAQQLIDGVPNVVVSPSEIQDALNRVNQANNDLNGNTNLANAKQQVTQALDQLPNLNQAQRDEFNKQINQATQVPDVNAIQQAANQLNEAMTALKQGIANKDDIKDSENYHDADTDRQTAFDDAINHADTLLNEQSNPTMDPDTIKQALAHVNEANHNLNGDQKLATAQQNAKTTLGTLDHLNQAQIDALTRQIDQAPDIATTNKIKQNAESLDNAMNQLNQALQTKADTLGSINYSDADQPKKDAYNYAVTHAESIVDHNSQNNASQDDIAQALKQLNDAKDALNGNSNVEHAKQEAIEQINNAQDLNPAQQEALKQQVNLANTVNDVNQVKATTSALDQAMSALKQGIADKDQTIADGNYTNANPDKQQAYSDAIHHAEQIINGTPNAIVDPQTVTNALQQVDQTKGDLNGNDNLHDAQQQASTMIDGLPNLNPAQKAALKEQVNQAGLVPSVDQIKQTANELNTAMGNLNQTLQANTQVPQTTDYTQASTDKQTAYDNVVEQAQQVVNGNQVVQLSPDAVNQMTNAINHAKDDLNGDENLAQAKQDATANLNTLPDLNQPQHDALTNQIEQAQTIEEVNQVKQLAQNVNDAMHNLKQGIANKNDILGSENYHDADPDKQTAYSDAVAHAQSIIDHQHGPNTTQPEVEQALTQVQQALQNLNGEQRLQDSKLHAQQAIDGLTDLNNPQKSALKEQVNHAPLITDVQQIEQQAGTLNQAMHDLRQSIDDNAEVKASSAYINEDPTEQHNYDQAVQHAQDLINEQQATLDTNVINQKTEDVNNSKQALQGVAKLQSEKDHAKALINQLPHLNDAQKHMEDALIDNETTRTAVKNDVTEAQQLDQYMDALQQSIADKQTTLDSSPYINADPNKKQDYDNAVQHAESIISGTTNPTINKDNVNQAIESVNATKQALNGVEKLAEDKQHAGETMNQFNQLTLAQQQALNDAITNAQTRDEVAQKVAQAEALNNAMQALKESVKDHQQVETSSQFTNEDPKQKDDYNQAVQHALDIINQATNPTLDQSQIEQATQAVINAKDQLHGEQKLAQDKQLANETIDHLQHLNAAQRQALQAQINQLPTRDEVAQKVAQAEALDESMKALRDIIQDHQQVESSSPFINEDSLEQNAYTNAIQQTEALINQTDHPTLDRTQVQQLTQAVTNAKDHLHGDEKLQNDKQLAVNNLNQLSGLNDVQRDAFESQINQAPTRNMVAESIAQANALNQAMVSLRNAIQNEPQVESSSQFINEDTPEQEAYKQAVSNAKAIINETTNPIMDKAQVDQTLQEVNDAIANLHGDQKLAQAQQQAIIGLDGLNNLNHDQLESAKDAVNQAPTRNDVAQIVQTANQLDQAMGRLKDVMNQANRESVEPNYTEASTDKQHAFNLALTNASHITDTQSGPNATQTEVENAITSLQQAMNDLDGNARVTNAKAQAIQDIDRQPHLNDEQKSAMKDQVNQATTLKSIEQIEDKSHQLDHATDQLQQAIDEHNHVTNTVDFTQADPDKQAAYNQAVAQAQQLVSQNATQQEVEQAITAIENAKHDLNGDEKVAEAKANAAQQLDQLTALNQAQHQAIIDSINNSNDVNDIQNIVNEATTLNHAMNELQQAVNDNNEPTKQSGNYINADTQLKHDFDEAITNAQQALDHPIGSNLTTDQINQLKDAINHTKDALNGNQRLNDSKSDALNKLDQLTHLNNAQKQMAQQQINTASTLNDVTQAIQKAATLDQSMNSLNQYVQRTEAPVKASSNYIDADEALKANYNTALDRANDVLNKAKGIALTNAEVEALKQAIINAENALNGDQNVTKAKGKADQFIDNLENLNPNQRNKAHQLVAQADDLDTLNNIINNQIDLDDVMKALKDIVNNDVPNSENSINYQNADDDTKANFTQAKDQAIKLLKGTDDEVGDTNDIQGAIQALKDAMNQLNGDARLQDAKNKAIQSINKALADKLNDIDNANATEQDKIDAKNKAEAMANQTINNINKATTNQAVDNVENIGSQAIDQIHANEIPKAQNDAKQDINRQSQELLDAIDHNPDLSNAEKEALKDQIRQLQQQANVNITGATTKEQIQNAKDQFNNALNQLKDLIQSKVDAKQAIKDIANAKRDEIN
ncbi:DUF1542 domain-containing protein [Staphylococcus warneri]|uniref:DUF1542 domain-containing protein n=2 Tax=Staphylococcus warneri TaxID=1292 RepID=UPI003D6A9C10